MAGDTSPQRSDEIVHGAKAECAFPPRHSSQARVQQFIVTIPRGVVLVRGGVILSSGYSDRESFCPGSHCILSLSLELGHQAIVISSCCPRHGLRRCFVAFALYLPH